MNALICWIVVWSVTCPVCGTVYEKEDKVWAFEEPTSGDVNIVMCPKCRTALFAEMKYIVIEDTHNQEWKKRPNWITKVEVDGKIFYMNYKQYWNDFLLCEPYPDIKLKIRP